MFHQADLLDKLRSRQALIGIVGLGYVGLPLSLTYAEVGFRVLGLDIDQAKADAINQAMRDCGCQLNNAYILHTFLALAVIPELRISDKGIVDVTKFEMVDLFVG